jgi:hypothetical protein
LLVLQKLKKGLGQEKFALSSGVSGKSKPHSSTKPSFEPGKCGNLPQAMARAAAERLLAPH